MRALARWKRVSHFAGEIQKSDFMAQINQHFEGHDGHGLWARSIAQCSAA
jgi:hypothetical protein